MSSIPITYHAEWWVPAKADLSQKELSMIPEGMEKKYAGNLTYDGKNDTTLELYILPSRHSATHFSHNDVMWGEDTNGNKFTLFNVEMLKGSYGQFSKTEYKVGLILLGEHVLSLNDTRYSQCVVKYPYLKHWAFDDRLNRDLFSKDISLTLTEQDRNRTLISSTVSKGVEWKLNYNFDLYWNDFDATIKQDTYLLIKTSEDISIHNYLHQILEFSQFLSIALFCEQSPNEISLVSKESGKKTKVLFTLSSSKDPRSKQLIKYYELSDKIPVMLKKWHEQYERVSPIAGYLIKSLNNKSTFDVPDFLILAQSLDGYHKRFVNKKDGKDVRQYEHQMTVLLKKFKSVKAVSDCHIDPEILKDSRHKYSHLYPDEEPTKAVGIDDLYWLTEKCKVLLTCCILNMIGLTNEEINLCCEDSPLRDIVDLLPPELNNK